MNYKLTVLTPLLVGDGQRLSPIDYMVWKDQINVLDQKRIFRLLAKGPRLEGYLAQIKKADRLDFASWGGFAQNFAGRRIGFEHPSSTSVWEQAHIEHLHIPTFCAGPSGAYLPGSALKGALRTGLASVRWNAGVIREIANRMESDRAPRKPGESAELMTLGPSGNDPMKNLAASDSDVVPFSVFKIYLTRVARLEPKNNKSELTWKPSGPLFAEMATPGTVFQGHANLKDTGVVQSICKAANQHASQMIQAHRTYAEQAALPKVLETLQALQDKVASAGTRSCVLDIGWGGGFLSKAAFLDTDNEEYRRLLKQLPYYARSVRLGVPFPKTRHIIFQGNQPASLPGWALFELV